jgi:hypothetical protein
MDIRLLRERERIAYITGDVKLAALLRQIIDSLGHR